MAPWTECSTGVSPAAAVARGLGQGQGGGPGARRQKRYWGKVHRWAGGEEKVSAKLNQEEVETPTVPTHCQELEGINSRTDAARNNRGLSVA